MVLIQPMKTDTTEIAPAVSNGCATFKGNLANDKPYNAKPCDSDPKRLIEVLGSLIEGGKDLGAIVAYSNQYTSSNLKVYQI
jgi:hypothetical protein